jgi:hypothetical protein
MAEILISPGVLARENDTSFVSQRPVNVGAAIIGPTVKGPVEIPTVVTTYSEFQNTFGSVLTSGSELYSYFTSIAALNYFNNGGTSLLVARVVSGSYTPAQSTTINNNVIGSGGAFASASMALSSSYTASSATVPGFGSILLSLYNPSTAIYTYWNIGASTYDGFLPYDAGGGIAYVSMSNPPTSVDEFGSRLQAFFNSSSWGGETNTLYNSFSASYNASADRLTLFSRNSGSLLNGTQIFAGYSGSGVINILSTSASFTASFTMGGGNNGTTTAAFVLETLSEGVIMNNSGSEDSQGSLISGSMDNVRWEITTVNTSSGTFSLLIRQGSDTTLEKTILETYPVLSLDPKSANFITKVIGDYVYGYNPSTNQIEVTGNYPNASRYVRVKQVNYLTPDYLDNSSNFKPQYTSSLPVVASGSFTGATGDVKAGAAFNNSIALASNTQGVSGNDYDNMIDLLSNQDNYRFNALYTPGLFSNIHSSKINTIIQNTQDRGDSIYIFDTQTFGGTVTGAVGQAASFNTSYAATYWPWVQINDPSSGKNIYVPASTMIPGVYAFTDSVSEPWFAPAGLNRGSIGNVIRAEYALTQSDRDTLYQGKVNPIATLAGVAGVVVYGQKTLQTKASALDRVNVRRLLIALKSYISQVANTLLFEQNTVATRNQFLAQVNPYLESVQQRQGLYAFRVIMDSSNNTPDVIDRNELVGQIYLQPTKTAEFIYLDFNITPTGATFPG